MLKIGLLSDTHAWWDDKYAEYFDKVGIPFTVVWGNHDNEIDLEPVDEMVEKWIQAIQELTGFEYKAEVSV